MEYILNDRGVMYKVQSVGGMLESIYFLAKGRRKHRPDLF